MQTPKLIRKMQTRYPFRYDWSVELRCSPWRLPTYLTTLLARCMRWSIQTVHFLSLSGNRSRIWRERSGRKIHKELLQSIGVHYSRLTDSRNKRRPRLSAHIQNPSKYLSRMDKLLVWSAVWIYSSSTSPQRWREVWRAFSPISHYETNLANALRLGDVGKISVWWDGGGIHEDSMVVRASAKYIKEMERMYVATGHSCF